MPLFLTSVGFQHHVIYDNNLLNERNMRSFTYVSLSCSRRNYKHDKLAMTIIALLRSCVFLKGTAAPKHKAVINSYLYHSPQFFSYRKSSENSAIIYYMFQSLLCLKTKQIERVVFNEE